MGEDVPMLGPTGALVCLWINAVLYVGFAVWCTLLPDTTSRFVGLGFSNPNGRSEYLVVYGGLEAGMGVFFGLAAVQPELLAAGVWFGRCLYAGLALWRTVTLFTVPGIRRKVFFLYSIELGMAVWFWLMAVDG